LENVVIVGYRTLGDERRLTGPIVYVITKSAILISAHLIFRRIIRSWSKIKSPYRYVLVYSEAVRRSAILATAWLLVFARIKKIPNQKLENCAENDKSYDDVEMLNYAVEK